MPDKNGYNIDQVDILNCSKIINKSVTDLIWTILLYVLQTLCGY